MFLGGLRMKLGICALGGIVAAAVVATSAIGDGHADKAILAAVKARQSQMTLYSFNISVLGGMAKGDIAYDAEAASAAASNLAALAQVDQSRMWPHVSDNEALGTAATRGTAGDLAPRQHRRRKGYGTCRGCDRDGAISRRRARVIARCNWRGWQILRRMPRKLSSKELRVDQQPRWSAAPDVIFSGQ